MKLDFLPGKKTYALGVIMLVFGLISMFVPDALSMIGISPAIDAERTIMEGLVVLTGRKAISRVEA